MDEEEKKFWLKLNLISIFIFLTILSFSNFIDNFLFLLYLIILNSIFIFISFYWYKHILYKKSDNIKFIKSDNIQFILAEGIILLIFLSIILKIVFDIPYYKYYFIDVIIFIKIIILLILLLYIWTINIKVKYKPIPRKMYNQTKKERVNILNKMLNHCDDTIHSRFNFFMVAESMLIVSFITSLNLNSDMRLITSLIIGLLGISFSSAWFYTNARLCGRLSYIIEEHLFKEDKIYHNYCMFSVRGKYAGDVLTYYLPMATILFWTCIINYNNFENFWYMIYVFLLSFICIIISYNYIKNHIVFFRKLSNLERIDDMMIEEENDN